MARCRAPWRASGRGRACLRRTSEFSRVPSRTREAREPAGARGEGPSAHPFPAGCTGRPRWAEELRRWQWAPQDPGLSVRGKRDLPLRFGGCISWVLGGQGASQGCLTPPSEHTEHTGSRARAESAESRAPCGPERKRRRSGLGCSPGAPQAGPALGGPSPPRAQGPSTRRSALRFSRRLGQSCRSVTRCSETSSECSPGAGPAGVPG